MRIRLLIFCACFLSAGSLDAAAANELTITEAWPLLPAWVKIWSVWLFIVTLLSLVFIKQKPHGKWIAALLLSLFAVIIVINQFFDPGVLTIGLLSVLHVVFWTPVVIILTRSVSELEHKTLYGAWSIVLMISLWISLLFDYQAAAKWLFG